MVYNPNGKDMKTKVVEDNLNPIFYEVKDIMFDCISLDLAPPFIFTVYDTDAGLLDYSDDFLGRAVINLSDINPDSSQLLADSASANTPPNPKWYGFRPSFDKKVAK
jgi:Ca2+-dependent lipid-binding protein